MSKLVLIYFNAKALGESLRLLLAYGGEEFEDRRVEEEKEWPELMPSTPFGMLPLLEVNGKRYAESIPIARYLGRKFGVAGATLEEDMEIDQNVAFYSDIHNLGINTFYDSIEEYKEKKYEELFNEFFPVNLKRLHDLINANNGHMALGKLTWADFLFAGTYDYFKRVVKVADIDEKYPSFKQLQDKVLALPKVKEFVAAAPKSEF